MMTRAMIRAMKISSDMTTPTKEGSSGMKSPATKTSSERRMSVKKRTCEEVSNGMLIHANKRFIERTTPAKKKSGTTGTSAEVGF